MPEMKRTSASEFRKNARSIVHYAKIWLCVALAVAVVLFSIHPAPGAHLLVMAILGLLWGAFLALSWRVESLVLHFVLIVFVSGSSTIAERLFFLKSQYQDIQGLMLAFASAGALFAVFPDRISEFSRLLNK